MKIIILTAAVSHRSSRLKDLLINFEVCWSGRDLWERSLTDTIFLTLPQPSWPKSVLTLCIYHASTAYSTLVFPYRVALLTCLANRCPTKATTTPGGKELAPSTSILAVVLLVTAETQADSWPSSPVHCRCYSQGFQPPHCKEEKPPHCKEVWNSHTDHF